MTNKEFLKTRKGKLAVIASAVSGAFVYISTDPSAALLLSQFLPYPWNFIAILSVAFVAYVLPFWADKTSECIHDENKTEL